MSVSGEFQRYLASTLENVEKAEGTREGEALALLSALRGGLESARNDEEASVADRAARVLDILELHLFDGCPMESCSSLASVLPTIRASAEDLDKISRIILGRSARGADKGTTSQE